MTDGMTDTTLRVEVRFKNRRLYDAIRSRAVKLPGHRGGPVSSFCRLHGIGAEAVYGLLNLRLSPWLVTGRLSRAAQHLVAVCEVDPEWLFPRDLYAHDWTSLVGEADHRQFVPLSEVGQVAALTSPEDGVVQAERKALVRQVVGTLSPREAQVVTMRYGLDDGEPWTLEEVGQSLALTRERIRQIEAKAIKKLRHPVRLRPLRAVVS